MVRKKGDILDRLTGGGWAAVSVVWGVAVFLFWWLLYPHALSYHEQYQLFLWTSDYLAASLREPGGAAAWLGECITQFYYVGWLGALLLALLFVAFQRLLAALLGREWTMLSLLPPLLLLMLMGDESVLLSYMMALLLTLIAFFAFRSFSSWHDIEYVPLVYWVAGPMAWLYVVLRVMDGGWRRLWTVPWLAVVMAAAYRWAVPEWQLYSLITGKVYYRIPLMGNMLMWVLPVVIVVLAVLSRFSHRRWMWVVESVMTVVLAALVIPMGYDKEKYELIRQDAWVRQERWDDIIHRAEHFQVKTPFSAQCVNLALAKKRQLADRMFDFWQSGPDALIMPRTRDLTSMLPSAEAFWHLGMVNSAQRYMFDTQESILNAKKSARCTQRIAECMIVNGHYQTAKKQLALLRHTLFYRQWAKEAEACLGDEAKVNAHPVWGRMRRLRYKNDFLYSYEEIDKMFALLFNDNNDNKMALDYAMAQLLLNGSVNVFAQQLPVVQQLGGYHNMPLVYQDVVNCIRSGGGAEGSPYMKYVNRMREGQP